MCWCITICKRCKTSANPLSTENQGLCSTCLNQGMLRTASTDRTQWKWCCVTSHSIGYKRPCIFSLACLRCSLWGQMLWKKFDYSETIMLKKPHVGSLVNSSEWALSQQPTLTPATRMSCLGCPVFRWRQPWPTSVYLCMRNSKQELLSWAILKFLTYKNMSKKEERGGYCPCN